MRKSILYIIFFLSCISYAWGQNPSRLMKTYEKGDFPKTRELLLKSIEKDSINPAAKYLNSILFMEDPFRLNTDSARWFINEALDDYEIAGGDRIEDMLKAEINRDSLLNQKLLVTADAFGKAKAQASVYAMDYFLKYYPEAPQFERAIFIRDSLAYDHAKETNTWQSYKEFLDTYPQSYYFDQADKHYQRLIFIERTLDNKLSSYIRFLRDFPNTPHRDEIEWVILSRSVVDHEWASYKDFISKYPHSKYRKMVTDIMYYIDKLRNYPRFSELLTLVQNTDSINQIKTIENHLLIPFYTDDRYGFMSSKGEVILENTFVNIDPSYFCGGIESEWLRVTKDSKEIVINRSGVPVIQQAENFEDLGDGVAMVQIGTGDYLYHKSGFQINERSFENATVLAEKFIKVQKENKWGLLSMLGLPITGEEYESIESFGNFIIVEKGGRYSCSNIEKISEAIKDLKVSFELDFEDFEVLGDTLLLTFNGDKEALYDENLNEIIPEKDHRIFTLGASWYVKNDEGYKIYNKNSDTLIDQTFEDLEVNNGWMAIKREDDWLLISQHYKVLPMQGLDSIRLINDYTAFIEKGDTLQLIFNSGKIEWVKPDEKLILLTSRENTGAGKPEYIMLFKDKYRKILSSEGLILFEGDYDQIDYLTDSLFTFSQKGKYGIIDAHGKTVISAKYETINKDGDLILLLEKGKIGCYNPLTGALIPPEYDSRISVLGNYFVIVKDNKQGMVNRKNEEVIPFEYEEFMTWNDTVFLAKGDSNIWSLITFDNELVMTGLMDLEMIGERGRDKFLKVLKEQTFGIISSKEGEIMQPVYNDIVNVGTYMEPVFFAEQHLEPAAFFVVTYFDRVGETLRSQAYRPDEYSKIYCDQ
ncbi:MAG: WG repeat-containing protein [Bacteroidota bacterium]